ncbi:uromodulin-like [Discoglossus pictus]
MASHSVHFLLLSVVVASPSLISESTLSSSLESVPATAGLCNFGSEFINTIGSYTCIDPCINHTILNDPWRSTNFSSLSNPVHCDSGFSGWYRFMGSGGIRLPETCPSLRSCNSEVPLWLAQSHPQPKDGIVSRTICGHWRENCCHWSTDIQIKACTGGYHVYKFEATSSCKLGYCTATVEVGSCNCTEDEECRLVDGLYGCYCSNIYEISDIENLRPLLTCGAQEIKASFRKCQLKSLKLNPNTIHLTDSSCIGLPEYNRTYIVSVVSLPKIGNCGNELIRNKTNSIYKNTIYLSPENSLSVSGEDVVTITYSCVYDLDSQIDLDIPVKPTTSSINISMEGKGEFVTDIAVYQDAYYLTPYEGSHVLLTEKSMLYIRVTLNGGDISQFNLVMKNCYVTPTAFFSDPRRYYIIKDSCPSKQNATINVDENGVSRTGKFSVQLFRYIPDLSTVFLHCEVHICDVTNETCAPICPGIKSVTGAFSNHVISVGPMTLQGNL